MSFFLLLLSMIAALTASAHGNEDTDDGGFFSAGVLDSRRSFRQQAADAAGNMTQTQPAVTNTTVFPPDELGSDLDEWEYQDDLRAAAPANVTTPAPAGDTTDEASSTTTEISSTTTEVSSTTSASSTTTEALSTTTEVASTTTPATATSTEMTTTAMSAMTTTEPPSETMTPDLYEYYYYQYFGDYSGGNMCYARDDTGKELDVLNSDADHLMIRLRSNTTFGLEEQEQMLHQFKSLVESYIYVATITMTESI